MSGFQLARHRAHHFFVAPEAIKQGNVTLTGQQAHQIAHVLRLGTGERLVVLDNSGWQYDVEITHARDGEVTCRVKSKSLVATEPRIKITLYQGLLRSGNFEFVLQKCTELGVVAFVPVITERSLIGNIDDARASKLDRWRRIITEAAEQAGRGKLPTLRPAVLFQQALEEVRGTSILAWEEETGRSLRAALRQGGFDGQQTSSPTRPFTVNILIGPEGGFSAVEVQAARARGIEPIGLGPRVLRAETAAVVAAALTLYEAGEMES